MRKRLASKQEGSEPEPDTRPVYLRLPDHTNHIHEHTDLTFEAARAFIELRHSMDEHSVTIESLVDMIPHYHEIMDSWRNRYTRFEGHHVGTEGNNRRSNTTRDDRPPRSRKSYG